MAETDQQKRQKLPLSVKFALFCLALTSLLFLPSTVLVGACMIPTLVALMVDNSPQRAAWLTVGCMNFAGTIPSWFRLCETGHRLERAFELVLQPTTFLLAYGAAAVGWFIYLNITPFVAGIMVARGEKRLKDIEKRQKDIISKWGQDVSGP